MNFFCHLKKTFDEGDHKREDHHIELGIKNIKNQIEPNISIDVFNNDMQARIRNLEGEGSGWLYERISSKKKEMCKTFTLIGGTYRELPFNNQAILNIQKR